MDSKNNTGNSNSGYRNSGNWNSGYSNSGNSNSGSRNSGNRNSGNWNSGYSNSGYSNSGNWNSGYRNSGDSNSGNSNSGNWNSGNWNSGDSNSGFFNSDTPDKIRAFNKDCDRDFWNNSEKPNFISDIVINKWITELNMTDEEKKENPDFHVREGYLKTIDYKEAWKIAYNNSSEEDKRLLLKLPNFDANVFEEITGINVLKKKR